MANTRIAITATKVKEIRIIFTIHKTKNGELLTNKQKKTKNKNNERNKNKRMPDGVYI